MLPKPTAWKRMGKTRANARRREPRRRSWPEYFIFLSSVNKIKIVTLFYKKSTFFVIVNYPLLLLKSRRRKIKIKDILLHSDLTVQQKEEKIFFVTGQELRQVPRFS